MPSQQKTQELVELFCQLPEYLHNLIYVKSIEAFCMYQEEGYFKVLKTADLERVVYLYLYQHLNKNLTVAAVKDFVGQIRYRIYREVENTHTPYIAIKEKKTLDMSAFGLIDSAVDKPAFYYLNIDPSIIAQENNNPPPLFQQFLDDVIVDKDLQPDRTLQGVIQEMMGYYLLDTLEAHATFFLVGCGQNGKSVLLNILRKMVGEDFCDAMSIEKLTANNFAAAGLIGKKVNICMEEESSYIKSDKFKAMVSGDPISVERKYGESFMWTPTVKHVFATNEMPTFSGLNFGLIRRIKIIPFNRKISEEKKDTKMTHKLLAELSGIMAWALQGAKRLIENNYKFTESKQMTDKAEEFQENISAAILFFNERYDKGFDYDFISNDQIYEEYKLWAEQRGKKKQSYYVFLRDIETSTDLKNVSGKSNDGTDAMVLGKCIRRKNAAVVLQEPKLIEM